MARSKRTAKAKAPARVGFFAQHQIHAKQAFDDIRQRPLGSLLTILVLALALTLPTTFYLVAKNISSVASGWKHPTQLSAYLLKNAMPERIENLQQELSMWPEIESIDYVSPDEGLRQFRDYVGFEESVTLLQENPLPGVFIILPKPEWQQNGKAQALAAKLGEQVLVDEVRLDSDWLQRLTAIKSLAERLVIVFVVIMLAAVFLVIGNTLRLQVLSHKEEIQVMKLVGATDSFILRPYLYTGVWFGLLSAATAWVFTAIAIILLDGAVAHLASLYDGNFSLIGLNLDETGLLLMVATIMGWLAAKMASNRHLREIEPV
ncbi:Cell division protein FtsX [Vibrio stylophorae]|uniref:Cell division protein FtsX n=1 Tax=Vibrio stylophorae TaxID=659351 RepID=A0ABM8ZWM8_9VIBR|nr:permease-like cell division protein FtsX [Vibrio stylophorae]CAH0534747.1 Cell division protein FtsX [Vibrio stylophorae]